MVNDNSCLTVYHGAKLNASCPGNYAIYGKIKSGTDAVWFEFSDDGIGWSFGSYTSATTAPTNKYAKVGYNN